MARRANAGPFSKTLLGSDARGEPRGRVERPEPALHDQLAALTDEVRAVLARISITRTAVADVVAAYEAIVATHEAHALRDGDDQATCETCDQAVRAPASRTH